MAKTVYNHIILEVQIMRFRNVRLGLALLALGLLLAGCAKHTVTSIDPAPGQSLIVVQPPGVVEYVWEEPMVDVIDVPAGLDPEGHYYRPSHQEVVEIRQGRWRYYRKPEDKLNN